MPTEQRMKAPTFSAMRALISLPRRIAFLPLLLAAGQFTGHFVDGIDLINRSAGFDHLDQAMMEFYVSEWACLDQPDVRAACLGFGYERAGLDTEFLGLVARGDATRRVRHDRHHSDRLTAQLRTQLLLDRSEVGIEIDVEGTQGHDRPLYDRQTAIFGGPANCQ
jgi:hypothetical protein